jgi:hypothetical protein
MIRDDHRGTMSEETPRQIERLVRRLARRIRTQRAVEGVVTGATVTAMAGLLALVLLKTGWIEAESFFLAVGVCGLAPLALGLAGWLRQLDHIAVAQRLDRTHNLHDRLSTALWLATRGPADDFERAQIADAADFVGKVEVSAAAPMRRPLDLVPLAVLAGCFAALVVLRPPSHDYDLPVPPPIQHEQVLDSATIAMERNRLEAIKRELKDVKDPQAVELLEEIEELLNQVEDQEISEREFLDKLKELEEQYLDENEEKELERIAEKMKEAAEALEKEAKKELAQEPEAQKLVDALKKKDLAGASKAMEKIAKMMADKNLSEKQLKRLAKIMEKLAKNIDFDDPALQKLIEMNQALIDKLSKKFDKLSDKDKNRLNRAKEETQKGQDEQKKNEERESTRKLKKLRRLSQKASEEAEKVLKGGNKKNEKKATEDTKHKFKNEAGRQAKEAAEEMGKGGQQQKRDAARDMARKQLRDMREAMQRSGKQRQGEEGKQQDGQKGQQMKEFLERAKGRTKVDVRKMEDMKGGAGSGKEKQSQGGEGQALKDTGGTQDEAKDKTNYAGKGKGSRELGEETKLDSKRVDERVDAQAGEGPSRSEIIKSASEEGFATTEYKDVYVDYSSVVEEVMEKEKIPAGYRYYIKRYFQLIQPQE